MYKRRPELISFIGYSMVILSFCNLIRTLFAYSPNDAATVTDADTEKNMALAYAGFVGVMVFVCGVFILQGRNWARWLYAAFCGLLLTAEFLCYVTEVKIPGADVYANIGQAIIVLCLFLPRANRFFAYDPYR